jgi:hypothetical protein
MKSSKALENRTMVFIDLENSCGSSELVASYHAKVLDFVKNNIDDERLLINYSTGPRCHKFDPSKAILQTWSAARFKMGHGLDGADNCLIDMILNEPSAMRSRRVFIVSGDHIFTDAVKQLRLAGVEVTVVARQSALNHRLAEAANKVDYLPEFFQEDFVLLLATLAGSTTDVVAQ